MTLSEVVVNSETNVTSSEGSVHFSETVLKLSEDNMNSGKTGVICEDSRMSVVADEKFPGKHVKLPEVYVNPVFVEGKHLNKSEANVNPVSVEEKHSNLSQANVNSIVVEGKHVNACEANVNPVSVEGKHSNLSPANVNPDVVEGIHVNLPEANMKPALIADRDVNSLKAGDQFQQTEFNSIAGRHDISTEECLTTVQAKCEELVKQNDSTNLLKVDGGSPCHTPRRKMSAYEEMFAQISMIKEFGMKDKEVEKYNDRFVD